MKRNIASYIALMMLLTHTVACSEDQPKNIGKLKGKKIVMIIAQRMFEDTEFKEPKNIFDREQADVMVASSTLTEAVGSGLSKMIVKPDLLINDIKVDNFDAVVYIGGFGSGEYFDNPVAHKIARQAVDQGKIVAAICMAPSILANAGLLRGKKATCAQPYNIQTKGAIATGKNVERDGNIITANGPGAAVQFGETIASALSEQEQEQAAVLHDVIHHPIRCESKFDC